MGKKTISICFINNSNHVISKLSVKSFFLFLQFEPVFDSASSMPYLQHIILYECSGSSSPLEMMSREQGRQCYRPNNPSMACNAIVATWAKGSEVMVSLLYIYFIYVHLFILFLLPLLRNLVH